jgi:hypothetical protein
MEFRGDFLEKQGKSPISCNPSTGKANWITSSKAGGFFEERLGRPEGSINGAEANEMRRRHGWEIVGPPPF